jgi:phosphate:Na+ symporter
MPVDAAVVVKLLGGIGLFLLGIHHLTEGLKGLSGDSLRKALQNLVSGRFSAVATGVILTVATQSSTATILTVLGFAGAGLVTLTQAIAVNMGATLGTTSTPWMVAILGLRVQIATAALPILGVGAFLWLIARGKMRSLGAVLAGFGLIFIGIDYLQSGMADVSWNLEALAGKGFGAMWILAGIGIIMTFVMQSSSAAAATTLVALDAGSLTFEQGCAMIVGQSIGTAATTALAVIGVKRWWPAPSARPSNGTTFSCTARRQPWYFPPYFSPRPIPLLARFSHSAHSRSVFSPGLWEALFLVTWVTGWDANRRWLPRCC